MLAQTYTVNLALTFLHLSNNFIVQILINFLLLPELAVRDRKQFNYISLRVQLLNQKKNVFLPKLNTFVLRSWFVVIDDDDDDMMTNDKPQLEATSRAPLATISISAATLPVIDRRPLDSMVAEGQGSTLRCHAEGAVEYTWSRVGGSMPEAK